MDRVIVYPGALPQTTDQLNTNKFGLVGQAYQNRAILGTNTVVSGLAATPTSPTADLHVTIGVGSIYQVDPTDQAAYGDLGVDNNNIVKQGINAAPVILSITPPGTSGFSQVFLVEAILNDVDAGQVVLSYFNSANPASPFSGPANSGTSNFTTRTCPCVIALKAGVAATTGTQVAPTPDSGFVGLYAVTVVNGQTQITSPNIVQLASAPFFPTLPSVPTNVQNGSWVYAVDTGIVNALQITPINPQTTALVAGMGFRVRVLITNTGASTITINGSSVFGPIAIRRATGVALSASDMISGQIVELVYDGTNFQMVNYLGAAATTSTITNTSIPYVADSGAQNALVGTYSPAITSGQQVAGLALAIKLANTITGACTINVNGLGAKPLTLGDATNPPYNVFVAGEILLLEYDGTRYQIVNTSAGMFYKQPTANYIIYVNTAIGSDTLYDGTSASIVGGTSSAGPVKTIGKAILIAFGYAPSQFTITIQVAAGTYSEVVETPIFSGPNIILNGASATSVFVYSGAASTITVQGPNTMTCSNISVSNNGVYDWAGFMAVNNANMTTFNTASGTIGGGVFYAAFGGSIEVEAHTFNGSANSLYFADVSGSININPGNQTFSTPISVAGGSAQSVGGSNITVNFNAAPTFVNPSFVSGPKFTAGFNGIIQTYGLGLNFFPGSSPGFTNTGGQISS